MYRKEEQPNTAPEEFKLPFEGKLREENRWVIMAQWIPWSEFETEYAELFSEEMGAPAKTFRMALGALIIKEKLGIRDNRAWCKERGIRISGPPLGRPPTNISKSTKKQALEDEKIRNSIEGKFGQGKRGFSLNRIMAKLAHTSETAIAITFLVINLSVILRQIFWSIFLFNYFFRVINYHNLSVNSLTRRKVIYYSYFIS